MKFRVNSRELARAIGPSVEVATKNCQKEHDYEGLITFKADAKQIATFVYGGNASLIASISDSHFSSLNYECEEDGQVTVYAIDLLKSLTTMEPGDVNVKLASGEIVVTLVSDKDSKRSFATVQEVVKPPNVGTKFDQVIEVDKEIFAKGLHSVTFAPAIEEKMFTYMCVLMEGLVSGEEQILRFSAGTGGRFAIKSIEGKHIFKASDEIKIIFPKNNLSSIEKVISSIDSKTIKIMTVEQDTKKDVPEQIMIEFEGAVLCVFGLENFTKYPDLTSILTHKYSNRIYSNLKDWDYAVGGVEMSERGHNSNIHNTEVVFEVDNERFMVTPVTVHACTTPVNIVDDTECVAKGDKIWFKCNSDYMKDMISRGDRGGKIQLNFDSQELLADIPKDKPKQMRPVLVKFSEKSDGIKRTMENFYMFFTVSTK